MKIFEEGNDIRLQLMDTKKGSMLFDFKVEKDAFPELRHHIIENLKSFQFNIEEYLKNLSDDLEPKTHCCECTPGEHYQPHKTHIQYLNCHCDPNKYVLKKNE